MKAMTTAKKGLYIGTGAGLVLFTLVGLIPGSLVGGVVGLKIAIGIFGAPAGTALLPRIIVGASMLLGIFTAVLIFVVGSSMLGWVIGYLIEAVRYSKTEDREVPTHVRKGDSI